MNTPLLPVNGGIGNLLFRIAAYIKIYKAAPVLVPQHQKSLDAIKAFLNINYALVRPEDTSFPFCNISWHHCFQHIQWITEAAVEYIKAHIKTPGDDSYMDRVGQYDLLIHYRGTDFLTSPVHKHCRLTIDSIQQAMALTGVSDGSKVLVVTDDPDNVPNSYRELGFDIYSSGDALTDFYMLMRARNLLIHPGSTFSWWAGVLGGVEDRKVIMPIFNWPFSKQSTDITAATCGRDILFPGMIALTQE